MGGIITFIIGLFIGAFVGIVLMGLLCASDDPGKKWLEDDHS